MEQHLPHVVDVRRAERPRPLRRRQLLRQVVYRQATCRRQQQQDQRQRQFPDARIHDALS